MPAPKTRIATLDPAEYTKLKRDLQAILERQHRRGFAAQDQSAVLAYWQMGKRIQKEKLSSQAGYHHSILRRLCHDLHIGERTLQRAIRFSEVYGEQPEHSSLQWSQYQLLLNIPDPNERAHYESLAVMQNLSARKLAAAIENHHYQTARKTARGRVPKLKFHLEPGYCYLARVLDVIDGDTLRFSIDVGFRIAAEQTLRLAHVDTLERNTEAGRRIRERVREQLALAQTIVVQTRKQDLHGRYVAHVFFSPDKLTIQQTLERGRYLNQYLLNAGLAKLL